MTTKSMFSMCRINPPSSSARAAMFALSTISLACNAEDPVQSFMQLRGNLQQLTTHIPAPTAAVSPAERIAPHGPVRPQTLSEWLRWYGHVHGQYPRTVSKEDPALSAPAVLDPEMVVELLDEAHDALGDKLTRSSIYNGAYTQENIKKLEADEISYAHKEILNPDDTVCFWGDQHGDIQSTLFTLVRLRDRGIIDNNLIVTSPSHRLVFGGDFVDRGNYGIEVLTLLCQLFLRNTKTGAVKLARGNHEDPSINEAFGLFGIRTGLNALFGGDPQPGEIPQKYSPEAAENIRRAYTSLVRHLPVAMYLGIRDGATTRYVQCCHGGFEIGWDPTPFLNDHVSTNALILQLDRHANLIKNINQSSTPAPLPHAVKILFGGTPDGLEAFLKTSQASTSDGAIGYCWSDLMTPCLAPQNRRANRSVFNPDRGIAYGSQLIAQLPEAGSVDGKKTGVYALLRAHQHNSSMPQLLAPACTGQHGDVNQSVFVIYHNKFIYQGKPYTCEHPIPLVTTVATSQYTPSPSFIELRLAQDHKQWHLTNHYIPMFCDNFRPSEQPSTSGSPNLQKLNELFTSLQQFWKTKSAPLHAWKNTWEGPLDETPGAAHQ